jgi:hypothetical protein
MASPWSFVKKHGAWTWELKDEHGALIQKSGISFLTHEACAGDAKRNGWKWEARVAKKRPSGLT